MKIRRSLKLEMKRIEECNIFQDSEKLFTIDEGKESCSEHYQKESCSN